MRFAGLCAVFAVRDAIRPRAGILAETGMREGSHVLDYGCGPGGYIVPLARIVGAIGRIYALDSNPLAVRRVRRLARRDGLANVEALLSDTATGLDSGSLDAVLLYDVFHLLADPEAVLGELHRALKPEGLLSFSDHHMSEQRILDCVTRSGLFRCARKGRHTYTFTKAAP